jgi:hypothetical protein
MIFFISDFNSSGISEHAALERKIEGSRIEEFLIRNDNVTAVMVCRDHTSALEGTTSFLIEVNFATSRSARFKLPDEFCLSTIEKRGLPIA